MPLGDPVEKFERIRHDGSGSIDPATGRWQDGNTTTTEYDGTVQGAPADVAETLPEGDRQRVEYVHWTSVDLRTDSQYDDEPADHVRRQSTGAVYEVRQVDDVGSLSPDEEYLLLRLQES